MEDMDQPDVFYLTRGINTFSNYLHMQLKQQGGNDLFSPVNIHAFLVLLSQDPWFITKDVFNTALYVTVDEAVSKYKHIFTSYLQAANLSTANTSFLKLHDNIQDSFKNCLRDNFVSETKFLDFTNLEDALRVINTWINDSTVQKISHFDSLKPDVNVAFANGTHFKGSWAEPFSSQETVPTTFHVDDQNTIEVQMMRRKGDFYYACNTYLGAKIVKLPFTDDSVSMLVVLPDKGTTIDQFKHKLHTRELTHLTSDMTKQEVDVSIPKFIMSEVLELVPYLKEMGLEDVFRYGNCSGVIDGVELSCGEIRQKALIEVNEGGSEAAAGLLSTLTKANNEEILLSKNGLTIYEANISSEISNRFAKTKVVWRVKNNSSKAENADFKVVLTDTAFITEFVMEIQGKSYKSYIKEKEEAKNIYNEAVSKGQSAGLVEAKTRDSREFTVSVNLEPDSAGVFSLTYEEMLQRIHDQYELVLNISLNQIVEDLSIEVRINESRPLKFVKTPPLRSGNDLSATEYDKHLDPKCDIKTINQKSSSIKFRPDVKRQRELAHYLKRPMNEGLSGQFVVQYDVEREPLNGEILLQDGYFVHFFAPNDLDPLPKHIVFVLDTSGSMMGRKIEQLKDAMMNILSDLRDEDMLSIVEFNAEVIVWDVDSKKSVTISENTIKDFKEPFAYLQQCIMADPHRVSGDIIKKAKEIVQDIPAGGGTFMIGGLETGLYLVKIGQNKNEDKDQRHQPIIVFLTDGQPNVGMHSTNQITELVTNLNARSKVPIFSLSFGDFADKDFLRKLSLKNFGFSRHIYEAADASLQLQEFYKQVSSPLLHDINFKYDSEVEEVTRTWFPIYFRGSELVVAGRYREQVFPTVIDCWGPRGPIVIKSSTEMPVTSLERLWAYLTVKQLLDQMEFASNPEDLKRKAINLALKYSFVTDVTSLVVVKPNETASTLDTRPTSSGNLNVHKKKRLNCAAPAYSHATGAAFGGAPRRLMKACKVTPAKHVGGGFGVRERSAQVFGLTQQSNFFTLQQPPSLGGAGFVPYSADISANIATPEGQFGSGNFSLFSCPTLANRAVQENIAVQEGMDTFDSGKKPTEEFTANRPFFIILQVEKYKTCLTLFQGCVSKPKY